MSLSFSKQTAVILEALEQIHCPGELSEFSGRIFDTIERLIPGVIMSLETFDMQTGISSSATSRAPQQNTAEWRKRILELLPTHPAFPHVAANPQTVIAINDCISQREFEEMALYNDIMKPMDVAYQLVVGLQIPHHVAGMTISRDRDFTEDERNLVQAIAPHLALAHTNAATLTTLRRIQSAAVPATEALMVLGLTRREAEILHWIIQGKRDAEIAAIVGAKPRTVQKHVQNVLLKLGVENRTTAASEAIRRVQFGVRG